MTTRRARCSAKREVNILLLFLERKKSKSLPRAIIQVTLAPERNSRQPERKSSLQGAGSFRGACTSLLYGRTSGNDRLSKGVTCFSSSGRSMHLLLFQPIYNGHLFTTATPLKPVPTAKITLHNGRSINE